MKTVLSQLPIREVFGRDPFIAELWHALEGSSLRIEAERRIGKTCILRKMEAEPPGNWESVFLDVEGVTTTDEFAERICEEVHRRLTRWKKQGRRLGRLVEKLSGHEFAGIKFPDKSGRPAGYWKTLLTDAVEDLVEQQEAAGKRVVFLFDEMPWMLMSIAKPEHQGPSAAMEVLDLLRTLRQSTTTGQGFRVVFCGSIGLHHVLEEFRRKGYRNRPVNDMKLVEVLPLDRPVAIELSTRLLAGEGLKTDSDAPTIIAERTGGFAFYIHWVIAELRTRGRRVTAAVIDLVVKGLLTAPHDPCDFRHFKNRIDYYPGEENVVIALIDHAAASSAPLGQPELINVAKSAGAMDVNRIRNLLLLLSKDHYLDRDMDGNYTFRHALLREWWRIEQGLN